MTIRTAILEARFLLGDRTLYDELVDALRQGGRAGHRAPNSSPPSSPSARSATAAPASRAIWSSPTSRTARAACATCTRCSGSPNTSIACASRDELIERGVFDAQRIPHASAAARISSGRCAATCTSSPAAPRSGCRSTSSARSRCGSATPRIPGMQDVERFMKHYFLIAKDVGDLTAILCAKLEDQQAKAAAGAEPDDGAVAAARPRRTLPETDDFIVDNNRINLADADVFKRDPVNLIRIFRLAQKHNLAFHPDAMRAVTRSLQADRHAAAREPGSQPAVPRDPDLAERRRDRAAADERDRRARPLRAAPSARSSR